MELKTPPKIFVNALLDSYLDSNVHQDVVKMHAKESITLLNYANINISNINNAIVEQIQFSEAEISPFHLHDIKCDHADNHTHSRQPSLNRFSTKKIDFIELQKLLIHSFASDKNGRRPYPSAGGIYPVEPLVFLFSERIDGFSSHISGCYHFRPLSKKLQLIKRMPKQFFFENLLHGLIKKDQQPCFSILYLASIDKSIFKYRYRGYRHALMEAGSMYQKATEIADDMGLRNTVWSSFSEQQLMHVLGLDHSAYMPLTLQFFGYGDENV